MKPRPKRALWISDALHVHRKVLNFPYSHILEFDENCLIRTNTAYSAQVTIWHAVAFFLIGFFGCGCCTIAIAGFKVLPTVNVVFSGMILPILIFNAASNTVLKLYHKETVVAIKRMYVVLHQQRRPRVSTTKKWMAIGSFLKYGVIFVAISVVVLVLGMIGSNADPIYSVLKLMSEDKPSCTARGIGITIMRILIQCIIAFEATRTYTLCMLLLFLWLEMQFTWLNGLTSHCRKRCEKFCNFYQIGCIVMKTWEVALAEWIRIFMSTLFIVIVTCNVITVKYSKVVPLSLLWLFPIFSIINACVVYLVFPFLCGLIGYTKNIILQYKMICYGRGKTEYKVILSLRPMSIKCGETFLLRRKTKSEFYMAVVQRTIEGILL